MNVHLRLLKTKVEFLWVVWVGCGVVGKVIFILNPNTDEVEVVLCCVDDELGF